MSDLAERLEALHERNYPPAKTWEEKKERFLELLADGKSIVEASRELEETGRFFRKFRSDKSAYYDPAFTERFDEIMGPGGEHQTALAERARAALAKAADEGNVRAIEKILMAYDPDFQFLRPANFQGEVNIENFVQLMPGIPTEMLQQLKQALLESKQRELPVIDA